MSISTSDRFLGKSDNYVKYRPSYPNDILIFLNQKHEFIQNSICAEIGSGTGKFTNLLIQNKNIVFAVEPNDEMRAASETSFAQYKNFISISGNSENTNLKSNSIDFIFCAQSLHWFANEKTASEFKRILKPNGRVVIIWNKKAYKKSAFMRGIHKIYIEDSIDFKSVKLENLEDKEILTDLFKDNYDFYTIESKQVFDLESLIGRMMSISYAPPQGHPKHDKFINEIKKLFHKEAINGKVEFLYETVTYVFKF